VELAGLILLQVIDPQQKVKCFTNSVVNII
jgi:hypothetical protein